MTLFCYWCALYRSHTLYVCVFALLWLFSVDPTFLHSMIGWSCTMPARDAMIPFFQNRSNTAHSEDRPMPIHSDTSTGFFLFLCNLEFLYFSVLTRSSFFCVLNTIYYSISQLVGQKCWVCSPKVGQETVLSGLRIIYSQRNDKKR